MIDAWLYRVRKVIMMQAKREDFCVYCREVKPYSVVKKKC